MTGKDKKLDGAGGASGEDLEERIEKMVTPGRKPAGGSGSHRLPLWFVLVLLSAVLGAGIVLGATLLAPKAPAGGAVSEAGGDAGQEKTKYTCGMHAQIVQDEPGFCPICGMKLTPMKSEKKKTRKKIVTGEAACRGKKILYYQAPMDPKYRSPKPGKSPMGMDLIPACESEEEESAEGISIDPRIRQNMGVRLAEVRMIPLEKTIRTVGHVDYDERRITVINTKIEGWVERLEIDFTGQKVRRGQLLLSLYSPKLIATQQELLIAARQHRAAPSRRTETMLEAARQRLRYWDIPAAQIERIEKEGKIQRRLNIRSPISGIVVEKSVFEGQHVKPGDALFKVADLGRVWVLAHVYEMDAPFVKEGQHATIDLPYAPDAGPLEGRVEYIYPWLNEKSRDLRVRLVFDNPKLFLKPGMYVSMLIHAGLGRQAPVVDDSAVIRTGRRNVVFVELEPGLYAPREVQLGVLTDAGLEIRDGLEAGENVVVNGQFMLDSESRLKEALQKFEAAAGGISSKEGKAEEKGDEAADAEQEGGSTNPARALMQLEQKGCTHTCPMPEHFHVCGKGPGKCPECGMDLVPIDELKKRSAGG